MRYLLVLAAGASAVALGWLGCENDDDGAAAATGTPAGMPPAGIEGAGCLEALPAGIPYQPGCCAYQVSVPEVLESGFASDVGSSPAPAHVHLGWPGPTDSTFAVTWETEVATKASVLLYGSDEAAVTAADGPAGDVKQVLGHHMLYSSLLGGGETRVHEVHVCGLSASTTYYYKVGAPGAWSDVFDSATAPPKAAKEPFRFGVLGDSRNDPTVFAQIEEAISAAGADFQLFTGDAVATGINQADWKAFFEATTGSFTVEDALARIPLMTVNGNHENLAVNYVAQFALPQDVTGSEAAQGEEWYSFDYGNAHFIALNDTPESSGVGPAQLGWLEADLAAVDRDKTPWVFAFHHRSLYSCGGSHGSDLELRAAWQPIFDEHQVDVVLSGHDHLYERSHPIRGLNGRDGIVAREDGNGAPVAQSGTLYVVAGGAGAPLYGADDTCAHTRLAESARNYVLVDIADRKLTYAAYRADGTVLEQFEYSK